jgi:hypothetical protein
MPGTRVLLVKNTNKGGKNSLDSDKDNNASNAGLVSGITRYTYDGNGNMLTPNPRVSYAARGCAAEYSCAADRQTAVTF